MDLSQRICQWYPAEGEEKVILGGYNSKPLQSGAEKIVYANALQPVLMINGGKLKEIVAGRNCTIIKYTLEV